MKIFGVIKIIQMGVLKALLDSRLTKSDLVFLSLRFSFIVLLCLKIGILLGLGIALVAFFVLEKFI